MTTTNTPQGAPISLSKTDIDDIIMSVHHDGRSSDDMTYLRDLVAAGMRAAATAPATEAASNVAKMVEDAKRLLVECSMKPDRRFSLNKNRHHEARSALCAVIDALGAAATQARPAATEAALNEERAKFQQETRRTSELSVLLKRWADRHEAEHGPGPWAKGCEVCALVGESRALLGRPINAVAWRSLGSAQAWFDAKTADHEAFRAKKPPPERRAALAASQEEKGKP